MTRDRQGLQQSVLRVPGWAKNEAMSDHTDQDSTDWTGREAGDGTSVQPDSDFGGFKIRQNTQLIKLKYLIRGHTLFYVRRRVLQCRKR